MCKPGVYVCVCQTTNKFRVLLNCKLMNYKPYFPNKILLMTTIHSSGVDRCGIDSALSLSIIRSSVSVLTAHVTVIVHSF